LGRDVIAKFHEDHIVFHALVIVDLFGALKGCSIQVEETGDVYAEQDLILELSQVLIEDRAILHHRVVLDVALERGI
jgi:hypothetical protein